RGERCPSAAGPRSRSSTPDGAGRSSSARSTSPPRTRSATSSEATRGRPGCPTPASSRSPSGRGPTGGGSSFPAWTTATRGPEGGGLLQVRLEVPKDGRVARRPVRLVAEAVHLAGTQEESEGPARLVERVHEGDRVREVDVVVRRPVDEQEVGLDCACLLERRARL